MRFTQSSKKAFALSIVLWIVAALLFGVATMALLSKDTVTLTKGVKNKLHTRLVANDVFEIFKFYVRTADYDNNSLLNNSLTNFKYKFPSHLIVDGREYNLSKNAQISVEDTSMLLNVLKTSPSDIAYMATSPSQTQLRYILRDSLKDWRDKDDFVSLNGAEASKYTTLSSTKFKIRNSNSVQSPQELRLINGFNTLSKQEWYKLKKRLYYGDGTTVNLALLDSKYLAYILNIDKSTAKDLIKMRESDLQKYISKIRNFKIYNDDSMGFYLSRQFRITIKASIGSATSILKVLISFRKTKDKRYTIISYIMK